MRYLLDSNACIHYLRGKPNPGFTERFNAAGDAGLTLCSIVRSELMFGVERAADRAKALATLRYFLDRFPSFPFDDAAADHAARIRARLAKAGTPIGPHDVLIAGIALAHGLTLVTHNTGEFSRVEGLVVEDWEAPAA